MSVQTNYRNKINVGQQKCRTEKGKKNEMQDKLSQNKRSAGQKRENQTKCRTNYRRTKEVQDKKGKEKRNAGQIIAERKKCRTNKVKTNYCRKDDGNTKIKSVLYILKKFTPNTKNKSKFYKNPFLKLFLLSPD